MTLWIQKNQKEFFLLLTILLLAAFFRLYKIDQYMQFLGDQGRDAIIIKQILVDHHFPAIGPPSSVGTIYLGPLYYYMMAASMLIFWLNPVAASVMVAIIGVASVLLIYYLLREWFGKVAAIVSAFFYAISPVAINYSKFSWNPNPVPFFTLLAFLGIYKAHKTGNFYWFILSGLSLAAVVQMHYLALILLPIFVLLWLNELKKYLKKKNEFQHFAVGTAMAIASFLVLMSPLAFFDIRHNYINYHGLIGLMSGQDGGVSLSLMGSAARLPNVFIIDFLGRYVSGNNTLLALVVALLILIPIIRRFYLYAKGKKMSWVIFALSTWLFVGFFGLLFYKGPIYDHYLAFLSPIPFILLGAIAELDFDLKGFKYFKLIVLGVIFAILTFLNLSINPLLSPPINQLEKTQTVSKFIISQTENKPFNFALLSANNYDSAYQFYLDQYNHKPLTVPDHKTDQLFVVCEDEDCKPIGNPKYEIAAFGWTKQEWEKDIDGVKVFKLVPNPEQVNR